MGIEQLVLATNYKLSRGYQLEDCMNSLELEEALRLLQSYIETHGVLNSKQEEMMSLCK